MLRHFDDNVGSLDAAARVVLGLAAFGVGVFTFTQVNPNWALFTGLPGLLLMAYLWLTAAAHADPVYVMFRIDTVAEHRRTRAASAPAPR